VDYVSIVRKFLELNSSPQEVKREKIPRLLTQLNQVNQEKFNWVEEVFEGIHVKEHGGDVALNWTNMDTGEEGKLTYAQLSKEADRVLSHLRKEGVREGGPCLPGHSPDPRTVVIPLGYSERWICCGAHGREPNHQGVTVQVPRPEA